LSQDAGGSTNPSPGLTDTDHAQAEKWAQQAREGIVGIFNKGWENLAPVPKNWEIESLTVSKTGHPDGPQVRATNAIGSRTSVGGRSVQVGNITIYPSGARSFQSVFIRLGHEIGHFFPEGSLTESQLTGYGRGLWNVYQGGGTYSGPRP
jgi:hypothetical protein